MTVESIVKNRISEMGIKNFIGSDVSKPEIEFDVFGQRFSVEVGMTRLEFGEAIDDAISYLERHDFTDKTKSAIESEENDNAPFDWRSGYEDLDRESASEIKSRIYERIWEFAREAFEEQLIIGLRDQLREWETEFLEQIGEGLFGSIWQTELARALEPYHEKKKLDPAIVRRWAGGVYRVPAWAWEAMAELLLKRASEQIQLAERLQQFRAIGS